MAITITEQFRADLGGRKWRAFQLTHDESTSTVAAISIDLNYIDFFTHSYTNLTSAPANTSITARYLTMSINATRDTLTITQPPKAGSKSSLLAIGW